MNPPPCPTPVCVETTAPDGSVSIACTSIAVDGCCLAPIPNTSQWAVVCSTSSGPGGPTNVPTLSGLGIGLLAVALALVGLRKVRG